MKHAKTMDELPDLADLASQSGLDFMRGILDGRLAAPPIAATLGFELTSVEAGVVTFEGAAGFGSLNTMRGVHGGWYGAILDSALGCAVMTMVPQGSIYTTLEYKVNITRALPQGVRVQATGRVDHAGRSTCVAHGEIRGVDDDRLYGTGSTTCIIMPAPEP